MLVSGISAMASTPPASNSTSTTQVKTEKASGLNVLGLISRSTSLNDFKDGSRTDGLDIILIPSVSAFNGKVSTQFAYSQNLKDPYSQTENDFADIPIIYAFKPIPSEWKNTSFVYSLTALIPFSKSSRIKDELQTALSGRVGLVYYPADGDGFNASAGISLGRNFHRYEEDINGSVLNQFSSIQNLILGYKLSHWSIGLNFINRSRQTYKGSVKSSFELTESISYSINDNYSLTLGHTNAGSTLKANGVDSNIELINENSSVIYGTLGIFY